MSNVSGNPTWQDEPSTATPETAAALNNIETAVNAVSAAAAAAQATASAAATTASVTSAISTAEAASDTAGAASADVAVEVTNRTAAITAAIATEVTNRNTAIATQHTTDQTVFAPLPAGSPTAGNTLVVSSTGPLVLGYATPGAGSTTRTVNYFSSGFTLSSGQLGQFWVYTGTGAATVRMPTSGTAGGFETVFIQGNTGQLTLQDNSGNPLLGTSATKTAQRYARIDVVYLSAGTPTGFLATGNLAVS